MDQLGNIIEKIRETFEAKSKTRDSALQRSRSLIRTCSKAIRAAHREDWSTAEMQLESANQEAAELVGSLSSYPDLYHTGYTQDALKEYVEAHITVALIKGDSIPTPDSLGVEPSTYLGGLVEAATEMRRRILDIIRHSHSEEATRLLEAMDAIYGEMISVDFPDAITHGLRRKTDVLRGVLERTRGDMTTSLRQQQLQDEISRLERRLEHSDDN